MPYPKDMKLKGMILKILQNAKEPIGIPTISYKLPIHVSYGTIMSRLRELQCEGKVVLKQSGTCLFWQCNKEEK
jgi:hypothetical protein